MLKGITLLRSLPCFTFTLLWFVATLGHAREQSRFDQSLAKANAGDAAAQWEVGTAYDSGRGVRRDGKEAKRWYLTAAEQGYAEAQNSLGSALQAEGHLDKAREWYEKASAQNHALATNNLAYLYDLGLGVPQDRKKAFELYSRSADLGWGEAMFNIAVMYGAGQIGGAPDLFSTCVWTVRADMNARGQQKLIQRVNKSMQYLEHNLPPEQLATCRKDGQSWNPPLLKLAIDVPQQ